MPNDPDHVCTAAKLQRGGVVGSSFGFRPTKTTWRETEVDSKSIDIREVEEFNLYDVGNLVDPDDGSTTAGFRSAMVGDDTERKRLLSERGQKPDVVIDVNLDWESAKSDSRPLGSKNLSENSTSRIGEVSTSEV